MFIKALLLLIIFVLVMPPLMAVSAGWSLSWALFTPGIYAACFLGFILIVAFPFARSWE